MKALWLALICALMPMYAFAQCYMIPCRTGATASAAAAPVWTYVDTAVNASCAAGNSCVVTGLTSTQTNSVLIAAYEVSSGFAPNISAVSGGGGAWPLCPSTSCYESLGGVGTIDQAYNVTGSGGATSVTVTLASATSQTWIAAVAEWHCTANCGTIALDQIATNVTSSSCASCTGASFSGLTGTSDICEQLAFNNGITGYGTYTSDSTGAIPYLLNSVSGTAPTFTQPTGSFIASGMCFK